MQDEGLNVTTVLSSRDLLFGGSSLLREYITMVHRWQNVHFVINDNT